MYTQLILMHKAVIAAAAATLDLIPQPPGGSFAASVDTAAASLGAGLSCHARDGLDLSGDAAFVWGTNFHVASASACCEACAAHRAARVGVARERKAFFDDGARQLRCGRNRGLCNAFVYCAAGEQCFSYDIHVHRRGECWLKHEPNITAPIAAGPTLPEAMRKAPRAQWPWAVSEKVWQGEPPARLSWQSGIVAPANAPAWRFLRAPGWHRRFCNRHGPC